MSETVGYKGKAKEVAKELSSFEEKYDFCKKDKNMYIFIKVKSMYLYQK